MAIHNAVYPSPSCLDRCASPLPSSPSSRPPFRSAIRHQLDSTFESGLSSQEAGRARPKIIFNDDNNVKNKTGEREKGRERKKVFCVPKKEERKGEEEEED